MRGNWEKVNRAIRKALEELTLADMALTPFFPPPAALVGAGEPVLADAVG